MLAEQLEVLTGAWGTPVGRSYSVRRRALHLRRQSRPAQAGAAARGRRSSSAAPGGGARPRLAARYADEIDVPFAGVDAVAAQLGRADEACRAIGRDPATLVRSTAQVLCAGARRRRGPPPGGRHRPRARGAARPGPRGHGGRGRRQDRPLRRGGRRAALPAGPRPVRTSTTWSSWPGTSRRRCSGPDRQRPASISTATPPTVVVSGRGMRVLAHREVTGARRPARPRARRAGPRRR